jgi:HSP20 family molecular chaperone IbpA
LNGESSNFASLVEAREYWLVSFECNVERVGEDRYQISLAVAGFSADEIAIIAEQSVLTVEGRKSEKQQREFLYQGISSRPFKRQALLGVSKVTIYALISRVSLRHSTSARAIVQRRRAFSVR